MMKRQEGVTDGERGKREGLRAKRKRENKGGTDRRKECRKKERKEGMKEGRKKEANEMGRRALTKVVNESLPQDN